MRPRTLAAAVAALLALVVPEAATAHPLGNFSVNRASEIVLSGDAVYLRYTLDLAEIPTFQEGEAVERPGYAARLARHLELRVDGRRVALRPLDSAVERRPGAGGLPTLRFEALYAAGTRSGRSLAYRDRSFPGRRGWREVVVRAERGAAIAHSTAPAGSPSRGLRAYPPAQLGEQPAVTTAKVSYRPGPRAGIPPAVRGPGTVEKRPDRFAALVDRPATPGFLLVSLALALFWGAAHGLGPGHGKALVAGYLVGARGTARHAVLLGLVVTITHTAGVFALGLVTLALSAFLVPEQLYPWLSLVSGLLVLGVGAGILRHRLRGRRIAHRHAHHHHHATAHDHAAAHEHDHHRHERPALGLRGILGAGVAGGIVPCPTALVVLLAAVALHRVGYGLILIVAFSAGLAATVTAVGLVAVGARRVLDRGRLEGPLVRSLPTASALVVVALGFAMTLRALPSLL